MVRRAAIGSRAQEAHESEPVDSGPFGCLYDVGSAHNMNRLIGARPELTIDSGAMRNRFASFKGPLKGSQIADVRGTDGDALRGQDFARPRSLVDPSRNDNNVVTGSRKGNR